MLEAPRDVLKADEVLVVLECLQALQVLKALEVLGVLEVPEVPEVLEVLGFLKAVLQARTALIKRQLKFIKSLEGFSIP